MSGHVAASVADHAHHGGHGGHEHHWETSAAPLLIVAGLVFVVPFCFTSYFVYASPQLTILFAGIGVPVLLFGIARWVSEALSQKAMVPGAGAIGFPMFIVSEIFMFLALFVGYWAVRLFAVTWPPEGTPQMASSLPLAMFGIMALSSVSVAVAGAKHERGDLGGFRAGIMLAIVLGLVFLGCTASEYSRLWADGFTTGTNAFSSAYYSITGFHAIHVVLGIGTFLFMLVPAFSGKTDKTFVLCASVFWHFLTATSVFVITQVYFW